jgi:hypothetical protein
VEKDKLLQELTKAMKDLSETVESLKREKSALTAERDALKAAERLHATSRGQNDNETTQRSVAAEQSATVNELQSMLNEARHKISNRETVIENQTKNIQEFREKLRTKEVELRTLNERQRTAEIEWNRQRCELVKINENLVLEKKKYEEEIRVLNEKLYGMSNQLKTTELSPIKPNEMLSQRSATAAGSNEQNSSNELQLAKEKLEMDKTRLERELKMLNETLYSTVAARNKAMQESKSLQEQLQIEKNKFTAHEQICSVKKEEGSRNNPQSEERVQMMNEITRLKSEVCELTKKNTCIGEEIQRLLEENAKLQHAAHVSCSVSRRNGPCLQV